MAPKNKKQKKRNNKMTKFNELEVKPQEEHDEEEDEEEAAGGGEEEPKQKKNNDELNIEDVLRWGGTKADYVMLASMNDDNEDNELIDGGKKGAIDDLEDGELEKFIAQIGIRSFAAQQIVPDQPEEPEEPGGGASQDTAQTEGQSSEDASQKESKKAKAKKDPEASKDTQEVKEKKTKKNARKNAKQSATVFEFQPRQFLLVKPGGKWYDLEYSAETPDSSGPPQDASVVNQYKALAQQLFDAEAELYKTRKSMQKGANTAWMKNVVSTGTLPDRMAAMTVLIQDAPVHTLEHVDNLVNMVTKKASRRQGMMALDTLAELLISDLLPESRKLRHFTQRPFDRLEEMASGNRDSRDRRLVLWYFEDRLKRHVAEYVTALDGVAHDTVAANKAKALATAHRLLCSRPEQERALLIQVVNKVGDPESQTAAKASYLLETVLHEHPNMKGVVCSEVERLMFRPNISPKAQYYAICFLNQVLLSHEEAELATKLISMYFSFFRACVKNKDVNSKMLGALLTGVNRAYPYTKAGDDKVKEQLDTLFKVVHMVRFNTAVQALMLLFQAMDCQQTISDRYYVALYKKLLDPGLCVSSRQSMFLNLLYKSMKADIVLRRVKAFVKRLLQVSQEQNATFACGALFLVSEVMKNKPGLCLLLQDNNQDGEEEVFKDAADDEGDDEEERFVDADKVEEGQSAERTAEPPRPAASWVHHQNLEGKTMETYDPLHRNPLYCGADRSTLWELQRLSEHYHPSVSLFAKTIIQGQLIQYTGDPLQDFTLIRFLDRFVFRNPKQVKGKQNTDTTVMQPKQKIYLNNHVRSLAVNCEAFLSKDESQIPVDEIFFHRFFKKQEKEKQKKRRLKREDDEESVEEVDDDEFERILDSAEGDDLFRDLPEDDLDFAGDVKSGKGKKKQGSEADSDDSDADMEDLDDEEVSLGSMDEEEFGDELEEEGGTFMGPEGDDDDDDDEIPELDEEEDDDDDSDVEEEPELPSRSKKTKRKITEDLDFSESIGSKPEKKNKLKKAKKADFSMFASAEEFGSMLDENAGSTFDSTGMNAMANTDKAGVKQLKWEAQRDDWMRGRDAKTLRRKKSSFNKRKMTTMFGQVKAKGRTFKKKK